MPIDDDAELPFPQWVRTADQRAMLRCVAPNLFVGGATAILERARPHTEWWAAVDLHGTQHSTGFKREPAFGELRRFLRCAFEDGAPVPDGLLDAVTAFVRGRGGPVLISCAMGVSRSATVAYAVIRAELGVGHDVAARMVACPAGSPLRTTLQSARRWADARTPVKCYACRGTGKTYFGLDKAASVACGACGGSGNLAT
jgi:hypothetical protein